MAVAVVEIAVVVLIVVVVERTLPFVAVGTVMCPFRWLLPLLLPPHLPG